MILTLENELGAWFVSERVSRMDDMLEVEDEKAKRWLRIQKEWDKRQDEIDEEVARAKSR